MKRLVYGELCLQLPRSPFGGTCREAARKNPGLPERSWGKISSAVFLPPPHQNVFRNNREGA